MTSYTEINLANILWVALNGNKSAAVFVTIFFKNQDSIRCPFPYTKPHCPYAISGLILFLISITVTHKRSCLCNLKSHQARPAISAHVNTCHGHSNHMRLVMKILVGCKEHTEANHCNIIT